MPADLAQTLSITIGAALVGTLGYRPLLITAAAVVSIAAIPVLTHPAQPPAMDPQSRLSQPDATQLRPPAASHKPDGTTAIRHSRHSQRPELQ